MISPGVMWPVQEADNSPPPSAQVKGYSYSSTPAYAFRAYTVKTLLLLVTDTHINHIETFYNPYLLAKVTKMFWNCFRLPYILYSTWQVHASMQKQADRKLNISTLQNFQPFRKHNQLWERLKTLILLKNLPSIRGSEQELYHFYKQMPPIHHQQTFT
jgi:hypothetical protein